jgi:predicted nucleotidyltransferase component of viral defense system
MEYLLEEAKDLGLPENKKRAILREYLQNMMLASIYRSREGAKLYFMGGTALRFCYRLPRFSEDLDYNARGLSYISFEGIGETAIKAADLEGLTAQAKYERRNDLFTAYIDFPDVMRQYGIADQRGLGLMVKLEVNQPTWPLETTTHALSYYGYSYAATVMSDSALITDKLCAMLERSRGRDIYDLIFLLKKGFPFDKRVLKARKHDQKKPEELIRTHLSNLGAKELKRLAAQIRPFLFKEEDAILVEKAPEYAERYLAQP